MTANCLVCGIGSYLPSGVCDHCNVAHPESELGQLRSQNTALEAKVKELEVAHDKLVERSVAAMDIADGEKGWEQFEPDCPMLESVKLLRTKVSALEAILEKSPHYTYWIGDPIPHEDCPKCAFEALKNETRRNPD